MAGLGESSTDLQEGERGFGFRVRDSLGALGGYLTWAEYREGHVEAEGVTQLDEDGKGVDGGDLIATRRE
jgi:hypothetical protein